MFRKFLDDIFDGKKDLFDAVFDLVDGEYCSDKKNEGTHD